MIDPDALHPVGQDHGRIERLASGFRVHAGPATDAFSPPDGGAPVDRLPGLRLALPDTPVRVSARVEPAFGATFDAGALVLRTDAGHWAKLAFERAPDGRTMAVSVVTRGTSDDANGPAFDAPALHLRLYRAGSLTAFHTSEDGRRWDLLRVFALPGGHATVDFIAQSPTGPGARATFTELARADGALADLRDGT